MMKCAGRRENEEFIFYFYPTSDGSMKIIVHSFESFGGVSYCKHFIDIFLKQLQTDMVSNPFWYISCITRDVKDQERAKEYYDKFQSLVPCLSRLLRKKVKNV